MRICMQSFQNNLWSGVIQQLCSAVIHSFIIYLWGQSVEADKNAVVT